MSLKGTTTTATSTTPAARRRETGFPEAAEPTTRLEALQKVAAAISWLPAAGAVAVGAGVGMGFPAEARAAKGAVAGEVRTASLLFSPSDDSTYQ